MIKILTYNIQHGLDYQLRINDNIRKVDLDKVSKIIKERNPDIVSFNEVYNTVDNSNDEYFNQIKYLAEKNGYPYYLFSQAIETKNGPYGNAFMSKIPFENYEIIKVKDPIERTEKVFYESRVITKFSFKDFNIFSTHFGLAKSEQENAYKALMNNLDDKKSIFIGDLNMTPDNEIINKIKNTFIDSTEYINTLSNNYTFPSINPIKKIDYIFVSKSIKIISSEVINYIYSDHLPIETIIEI